MLHRLYRGMIVGFLVSLIAYAAATQPMPEFPFGVETVLERSESIFSLAVGELDAQSDGIELVFQLASGHIELIDPKDWSAKTISTVDDPLLSMSDRPTLSIGDVDPRFAGNEVVASANWKVQSLFNQNGEWSSEIVFDMTDYIGILWGARTGDYDPDREGDEIYMIWETVFDFSNGYLYSRDESGWNELIHYAAEVGMDSTVGEFDPHNPGPDILITTEMGPTYLFHSALDVAEPRDKWGEIWNDFDNAGWVAKVGDVLPERPGNEVVYGSRYNNRFLLSYPVDNSHQHSMQVILQGHQQEHPQNMWDIAVGDVLPFFPGDEIVGVDEGGHVYLVWRDGDEWGYQVIHQDPDTAMNNVVLGDLIQDQPGNEIVVSTLSGKLVLISLENTTTVAEWRLFHQQ